MLADLLLTGTEAVLGYTLDKFDPADRVRDWLQREPARLAYQKALGRAYAAFARQYPELIASLFDRSFLENEAAPELAKLLTRHDTPSAARLAERWWQSINKDTPTPAWKIVTEAVDYFLRIFTAKLKSEPALQPLFDSRALDSLIANVDALTADLRRGLDLVLKQAPPLPTLIHGTVAGPVGGSVAIGENISQVTHVYHQYFYGDFAPLNAYHIEPDEVFQRVRVDDFVGRDWLTARVDAFLNDARRKSGVFLLVGEAGVGKTTFLAHLVRERRYLHLFAEQTPGHDNLGRAIESLAAQLVARYRIAPYAERDVLPTLARMPDFLSKLLRQAATTLAHGEKIVIVCDALDEAGVASGGNVLGLPRVLPDHVYLILSQRPVDVKLYFDELTPQRELLDAVSADNQRDVRSYLTAVAQRPAIAAQLRDRGYSVDDFVRVFGERSTGVWIYLSYIVREIEQGGRVPLDLATRPAGLVGYYVEYWRRYRDDIEKWDALYAPLLATLAATQAPLPLDQLYAWAGVDAKLYFVQRLLDDAWRAFIRRDASGRYTVYHASLRDFLIGDETRLPRMEGWNDELRERTRVAHRRIVAHFEQQCGGDWVALSPDDYARCHLSAHLMHGSMVKELGKLIEEPAWYAAQERYDPSLQAYAQDVDRALALVEEAGVEALPRVIAWSLLRASVGSRATGVPVAVLETMALVGQPERDLAYAALITELAQQSNAYCRIGLSLHAQGRGTEAHNVLMSALAAAQQIVHDSSRAEALAAVAQGLAHVGDRERALPLLDQALTDAQQIEDNSSRAYTLVAVARALAQVGDRARAQQVLEQAPVIAWQIRDPFSRGDNFSHDDVLAMVAAELAQVGAYTEALAATQQIGYDFRRAEPLMVVLPVLAQVSDQAGVQEALELAQQIEHDFSRARVLAAVGAALAQVGNQVGVQQVLTVAQQINDNFGRAHILSALGKALVQLGDREGAQQVLEQALAVAQQIGDNYFRARALATVGTALVQAGDQVGGQQVLEQALAIAQQIKRGVWDDRQQPALAEVATALIQVGDPARALAVAQQIGDDYYRTKILLRVAVALVLLGTRALAREVLEQALPAARQISFKPVCARALATIGVTLVQVGDRSLGQQVLKEALATALQESEVRDDHSRGNALAVVTKAFATIAPRADEEVCQWVSTTFQQARQRGRVEILKQIMAFASVLGKLGVLPQTWEQWQQVERLLRGEGGATKRHV
jgi:tetratricopeptide (TPR) repeat protein